MKGDSMPHSPGSISRGRKEPACSANDRSWTVSQLLLLQPL